MQDMLLTAHLTYLSGRAYVHTVTLQLFGLTASRRHVFDDYTWDEDGPLYSRFNNEKWIPNRIPLTAIMSGENDQVLEEYIPHRLSSTAMHRSDSGRQLSSR